MTTHSTFDNVTVLIAEDDDGHADLIQELLRDVGVNNPILRFRDGRELLDFLEGKNPDWVYKPRGSYLLLLDIRMPRVDGVQALRVIKEDEKLRTLPVIMLTTTDDPREIQKCYQLGCNCYITKPVDFIQFSTVLRNLGLFLLIVKVPETPPQV